LAPWAPFRPSLITTPSSRQKRGRPIFPEIYRGHGGGEASAPFLRGQILPLGSPREGGKSSPSSPCGDPGLPPGIPVMHTIHDPRKIVVNPHNRVGITEIPHPLHNEFK
jgi:hypothetical protein